MNNSTNRRFRRAYLLFRAWMMSVLVGILFSTDLVGASEIHIDGPWTRYDPKKKAAEAEERRMRDAAPYKYSASTVWSTDSIVKPGLGAGPDIAVANSGTLLVFNTDTDVVSVLDSDKSPGLNLDPSSVISAEYIRAVDPDGAPTLISSASGAHHHDATAMATTEKDFSVLYLDVLRNAGINTGGYRVLLRYDYSGACLGGWVHRLRWTEGATPDDRLAVDSDGNAYVASNGGFITKYNQQGGITARWKILSPQMESMWLNSKGPWGSPEYIEKWQMRLSPERFEEFRKEKIAERDARIADVERQIKAGYPEFVICRSEACPALISGFVVDQDGYMYISGTGLHGILKLAPSGATTLIRIPGYDSTGRSEHPYMRDLAYHDGRLFAGGDGAGFCAFESNGTYLGRLVGPRGYGGLGDYPQIAVDPEGSVYVVDRSGLNEKVPWPDKYVPTTPEESVK